MKDKTIHKEQVISSTIQYTEYPMVRYLLVFVLGLVCVVVCKDFSMDIVHIFNIIIIVSVGIYIFFHEKGLFYVLTFLTGFILMNSAYVPIPHKLKGKIIPAHFTGTIEKIEKQSYNSLKQTDSSLKQTDSSMKQTDSSMKQTDSSMKCILDGNIRIVSQDGIISDEKYLIRLQSNIFGDTIPSSLNIGTNIETIVQIQFPKSFYIPTELNSKQVLTSKNIHALSSIAVEHIVITDEALWTLEGEIHNWRLHVDSTLKSFILPEQMPVLIGILFGNTSGIEQEDLELLGNFGLIHILSASGTHIVVITVFCWLSLFMIRSHLLKSIILGILLILFVYVTGVQISAFRAAIMSFIVLLLPFVSRNIRPLNLLAFSSIVMLLFQPTLLFSLSFYFSTGAIIGIYFCFEKFSTLLKFGVDKISQNFFGKKFLNNVLIPSISLSLSAGLITNIIGSFIFYKFSISSIIGNTVFLFLYVMAFVSSIITYIFSFFSKKLAYFTGIATSFFLDTANQGMEYLKLFIPTELNGYSIWIVATFLCIGTFYCIATKEFKTFILRSFVVLLCFPFVKSIAHNLPYQVKDDIVYRFPSATLLPIHQTNDSITYFLNIEPKSSQYSIERINRFLPLSQKKTVIVHNADLPILLNDTLKNISSMKISKRDQFLLYKYYLYKKTSQSTL